MTPREADIAFELERVADVAAVYAIAPPPASAPRVDEPPVEYVVVLKSLSTRSYAEVQARLQSVLTHEECGRVDLVSSDALGEPRYMARARRLTLSSAERDAARARAATRPPLESEIMNANHALTAWHGYEVRPSARRARLVVLDQAPGNIEPAFARLDVDVAFVSDMRRPPYERITLFDVAEQIRAGDVDLVLLDVYLAHKRADRIYEAMNEQFGDRARDHVFLMTTREPASMVSPDVFHMTRPGSLFWAEAILSRYPHIRKPLDPAILAFVVDKATRWLRP